MKNVVFNRLILTAAIAGITGIALASASAIASNEKNVCPENSSCIELEGTIRDFNAGWKEKNGKIHRNEPHGHPDFERIPGHKGFKYGSDKNIVQTTLGKDRKPIYAGKTMSTENQGLFDHWYRDVPGFNKSTKHKILLTKKKGEDVYTFKDDDFFPIDNKLWGNEKRKHNYHFTYEIHTEFTYVPGQTFTFEVDDDVWVFINDKRVIDLGGVHGKQTQEVELDKLKNDQGQPLLEAGKTYKLDFFFAERHTTKSHFRIETNIALRSSD